MQNWKFVSNDGESIEIYADTYEDALHAILPILGWGLADDELVIYADGYEEVGLDYALLDDEEFYNIL